MRCLTRWVVLGGWCMGLVSGGVMSSGFERGFDTLPAVMTGIYAQKSLHDVLPAAPGAVADGTLAGIDSNNNDVRDDVERAIHARHPDDANMRSMLMNVASGLQDVLLAGVSGNESAFNQAVEQRDKAAMCVAGNADNWGVEYAFVEAAVVNTSTRQAAFRKFNVVMLTQRFRIRTGEPCA